MLSRRAFLGAPLLGVAPVAFTSCAHKPGTGFPGYAFVANSGGRAVAAVDLNAFAVKKHIALDGSPTQIVSPAQRPVIFVLTPDTGTVHEISTANLTVTRKVTVGAQSDGFQLALRVTARFAVLIS